MTLLALLLTLVALQAGEANVEKGTLCVLHKNDQQCTATEGMTLPVVPAETSRAFVWASADGSRLLLGTIAAKASTVSIDEKSRSNVTLAIAGDRRRGWPLETRLTFASKEQEWTFPLSTKVVAKLRNVRLPPAASYLITIAAEHHLIAKRTPNAKKDIALDEIVLKPLPLIFGRVVNMKDEPIAGAQIVRPDGKIRTTTNEQGQFRTELAEPIPDEVLVTQAHFASALLPLVSVSGEATSAQFTSARDSSSPCGSCGLMSKTCRCASACCARRRRRTSPLRLPNASCPGKTTRSPSRI